MNEGVVVDEDDDDVEVKFLVTIAKRIPKKNPNGGESRSSVELFSSKSETSMDLFTLYFVCSRKLAPVEPSSGRK